MLEDAAPTGAEDREDVARVLAGEVRYDHVDADAQRRVRLAWGARITVATSGLDLATELSAEGFPWSECDAQGRIVVIQPSGAREHLDRHRS